MSTQEVITGFQWIYTTLTNDSLLTSLAPGGVKRSVAPPGTPVPFIIMGLQSGNDVLTMNAYRIMDDLVYIVKAVGPASMDMAVASAADRMDALLKLTSGTTADGAILACYRQSPLQYDDNSIAGETWMHNGGLYRLIIQKTN